MYYLNNRNDTVHEVDTCTFQNFCQNNTTLPHRPSLTDRQTDGWTDGQKLNPCWSGVTEPEVTSQYHLRTVYSKVHCHWVSPETQKKHSECKTYI
jgi:hypothetical protein